MSTLPVRRHPATRVARISCRLSSGRLRGHARFAAWTADLGLAFSAGIPPEWMARIETAVTGLYRYVEELIERRRRTPEDDLLTALVRAEEAGDRLSTDELQAMVVNLLFAGHDTTRSLIGILVRLFAQHPGELDAVRSDPSLAARGNIGRTGWVLA